MAHMITYENHFYIFGYRRSRVRNLLPLQKIILLQQLSESSPQGLLFLFYVITFLTTILTKMIRGFFCIAIFHVFEKQTLNNVHVRIISIS